jgi:uncharacterized membrane protein (Fun14 family)
LSLEHNHADLQHQITGVLHRKETTVILYVLGWMSIFVGAFHLRKASGVFLLIIGIAVVVVVRKGKRTEFDAARSLFQANIRKLWRLKKTGRFADKRSAPDHSTTAFSLLTNFGSKRKSKIKKKSDSFI